ncbi:MAG: aldehyde dehydrogenase family protein [Burkholderiaceae bacterium]
MTSAPLPRVTYTNIREDFSGVHRRLDAGIAAFEREHLGARWPHWIDGRPHHAGADRPIDSPIDRRIRLGAGGDGDAATVDAAITAARRAQPEWAAGGWQQRVATLRAVADAIEASKWELGIAMIFEVGKSRIEAMGEVEESIDMIRFYCDEMQAHEGFTRPMRRAFAHEATTDTLRPYGVFGVIAPFNYPVALSIGMSTGALLGGNTVVLKPSPGAGLTATWLARAFAAGGVPPGVFNVVLGGNGTGRLLAAAGVDGIAFTGSLDTGMTLLRGVAAGPHMRPVIAEMGGKNPCYVTASADLDAAAEGVFRSAYGMQGQKCSALSRVLVHRDVAEAFVERLLARIDAASIGDPRDARHFIGPLINEAALARYLKGLADAREDGRLLAGDTPLRGGPFDHGHYVKPMLVADLPADHRLNRAEQFLPLLTLTRFDDLADAIRDGNAIEFGLTAGIYTRSEAELQRFLDTAQAGVLYANRASGATTGAWPGIQSFCGWKGSGAGGKGGLGGHYLPQFMREQSWTIIRDGVV